MTLRQIVALIVFAAALYFGVQGARALAAGGEGYTLLVALFYCGWGVMGTLIAAALAFGKKRKPRYVANHSEPARGTDILGALFFVIFGLGCLCLAAKGVFTGSVETLSRRGSSIVEFAAHPLAFVFLLIFWSALGSGMLWVSWRLFRRERSG